jgi:hypothetical protein
MLQISWKKGTAGGRPNISYAIPDMRLKDPHLIRVNLLNYLKMRTQIEGKREIHTI